MAERPSSYLSVKPPCSGRRSIRCAWNRRLHSETGSGLVNVAYVVGEAHYVDLIRLWSRGRRAEDAQFAAFTNVDNAPSADRLHARHVALRRVNRCRTCGRIVDREAPGAYRSTGARADEELVVCGERHQVMEATTNADA